MPTADRQPTAIDTDRDATEVELVVTDLDGTFLSPDGTVSSANAEAVRQWCDSGAQFMVATGRPLRWLDVVHDIAGVKPIVIASNGAVAYDMATGDEVLGRRIHPDVAGPLIADLRREIPGTCFAVEFGWEFGHEPTYPMAETGVPGQIETGPIEQFLDRGPFVKLLVRHDDLDPDRLAQRATEVIGDELTVTHSSTGGVGLLEVSAGGVSKGSTLALFCQERELGAHQVAAFGDMPNDEAMLGWVGHPQVMGNAHPRLLGHGTVIGTNAEDAVGARLLEWLAARG